MRTAFFALVATLLASTAFAQGTAPQASTAPGVNPSTGVPPSTGLVDRNSGVPAASGDSNQTVAATSANARQPAHGANSFTAGEAKRRIESRGFQKVTGLRKDKDGVWRGTAMRNNASVPVWLDYKGNVSPGGTTASANRNANPPGTAAGRAVDDALGTNTTGTNPTGRNVDGTTGNPPGTAAGRAMDRTLGTNTTGTNPAANQPDGTPGNPPGTAAGRAIDRTLGTNTSGANPHGATRP